MQSEPGGPLAGVSETALGAAEMRAQESARPDRLIDDPYAAWFVAAAPPLFPDIPSLADQGELAALVEASIAGVAIRTRFFDDHVLEASATGCGQVVLLGAGLDTRALRLDWPGGVRVFELDLPELFTFKESVLTKQGATPRCERHVVPVDLRADWPTRLAAAGFEPTNRSAWVAEGLLVYLSHDEAVHLLTAVGDLSARGSQFSFDYDTPDTGSTLHQPRALAGMEEVASLWHGGLGDDPEAWLRQHNWEVNTFSRTSVATSYSRELLDDPSGGFLVATRT